MPPKHPPPCNGEQWYAFAKVLYGDMPDNWLATLQGFDRWRVIVNALTRLRVCADDGRYVFAFFRQRRMMHQKARARGLTFPVAKPRKLKLIMRTLGGARFGATR